MKLARRAIELVLDGLLIALVAALIAHGRRPAPPPLQVAHDPARCSACNHPNAFVGTGEPTASAGWDG